MPPSPSRPPSSLPRPPLPVKDLIGRLARPGLSSEEAEPLLAAFDGREGESALSLFGLLHDSSEPAVLRTVARVLARWAELPVAKALVPALEALLAEPAVPSLNKMAAAGLLEVYGEPVDYPGLVEGMGEAAVDDVREEALSLLLANADRAAAASNALERIGAMEPGLALNLVDDLGYRGDERAEPLLAALAHAADADMALAAIAALDRLALPEAHDALVRVAAHHQDPTVREQASRTLARLGALARRAGLPPAAVEEAEASRSAGGAGPGVAPGHAGPAGRSASPPPAAAASPAGSPVPPRLLVFGHPARDDAPGLLLLALEQAGLPEHRDAFVAVIDRERGLRSYAIAEALSPVALERLRRRLALGGAEGGGEVLAPLGLAEAQWCLQEAALQCLRRGGEGVDVVHALWLRLLGQALQMPA